jgi:GAF domain-containing protein
MHRGDKLEQAVARNLPMGSGVPLNSNGVTIRALLQQRTVLVDDLRLDDGYYLMLNPETGKIFDEYPLSRSELATPIIVEGKAIGVLNVEHPEPCKFSQQDAVFLEILAIHVAGAIKHLRDLNRIIEQETQFTHFAENSQDGVWIFDFEKGYTFVNPIMESIRKYLVIYFSYIITLLMRTSQY